MFSEGSKESTGKKRVKLTFTEILKYVSILKAIDKNVSGLLQRNIHEEWIYVQVTHKITWILLCFIWKI